MKSQINLKNTLTQLLSNLGSQKEIEQYLGRFLQAEKSQFAVIKVGGEIIAQDLDGLCDSLAFLNQIGLRPIVVHGAGPQLSQYLKKAGHKSEFIDGKRVTDQQTLRAARQVFVQTNLKICMALQERGVKTASITSGVFTTGQTDQTELGYVGEIKNVSLDPVLLAIDNDAIPVVSSIGETESGQSLNINADEATAELSVAVKPYKIIFLTSTGGVLDQNGHIISTIQLVSEYGNLMQSDWLHGGMKLKLQQIAAILSQLPATASVSITTPAHLAKELFTHKGSGTLVKKGETIGTHQQWETIKEHKLKTMIESSFGKHLTANYFDNLSLSAAYITHCYRSAAILTHAPWGDYLDKFVVSEQAKGEGLGKAIWQKLVDNHPKFFWRSRINNRINQFYFSKADGCQKLGNWIVFWKGNYSNHELEELWDWTTKHPETLTETPEAKSKFKANNSSVAQVE